MDEEIGNQYYKEQKLSNLLTLFSLLSILISIVGVFGLVLFETQYRRKEIGIRKIHGATVGEILRMFNKIYVRIVLACFVVAVPIATASSTGGSKTSPTRLRSKSGFISRRWRSCWEPPSPPY